MVTAMVSLDQPIRLLLKLLWEEAEVPHDNPRWHGDNRKSTHCTIYKPVRIYARWCAGLHYIPIKHQFVQITVTVRKISDKIQLINRVERIKNSTVPV